MLFAWHGRCALRPWELSTFPNLVDDQVSVSLVDDHVNGKRQIGGGGVAAMERNFLLVANAIGRSSGA